MVIQSPGSENKNYRDPSRPITIDGDTYIGVGSGIYPKGPGELLLYQATNTDLSQFKLIGSLLNISESDGCINGDTMVYDQDASMAITAIECPDIFLMKDRYVIITSLFCTNEYFIGDI